MKVALVAYALNVGGLETFLFGLARQLRAKGMEPTFVVTDYIGQWHDNPLAEGFCVKAILQSVLQSKMGHAREVARFLNSFDVVLLNHSRVAQSSVGLLPESTVAIPILHGDHDEIYAVGLANLLNVDMVVAVSEKVRSEAVKRCAFSRKVAFIRNGVDVFAKYPEGKLFSPKEPLKVVYVGRIMHQDKGVLYLPGIMARIVESGLSVSLDVVGDGEDMVVLRKKLGGVLTGNQVRFHGAIPHDEAMKILQAADVLLLPSHYEGQPVTLFEAMARGVVPIASMLKGITDAVITDGENGILAPVGDEEAFARALISLAHDRIRLSNMSKAAWRVALDEFGVYNMAQNYVNLILDCSRMRQYGLCPKRTQTIDKTLLGSYSFLPFGIHVAISRLKQ